MNIYIDSRESMETITEFQTKAPKDSNLQVVALPVFDVATELIGIELKSIDDFVGAVINIHERKTKEDYQRMESQFQRMCEDTRPVKLLLIHGSLENAHTKLHPNSFRGMVESYRAKGAVANPPVQVNLILSKDYDWIDGVCRLISKVDKYVEHPSQTSLEGVLEQKGEL